MDCKEPKVKLIIKPKIDQTWSIEKISKEGCPRGWERVFKDAESELRDISQILEDEEKIYGAYYPLKKDIFRAFEVTPLHKVKVVIVGQDPYYKRGYDGNPVAMGMSFSVNRGTPIPPSLRNIYKEIKDTVNNFNVPNHGDLTEWAKQGVLLLNICLTVRDGEAGSHGELWLGFINKVLDAIMAENPQCIYVCWGKESLKIKKFLDTRAIVFESGHPSGHSASKYFFGNNHFNLINEKLTQLGKDPINWQL